VLRLVLVLSALLTLVAGSAPAFAQRDVRPSAIPDFEQAAGAVRGMTGPYVAAGFGYSFGTRRAFSIVDNYACPGVTLPGFGPVQLNGASGCQTHATLGGLSGHAIVGWNLSGDTGWLSGIEIEGRLASEGGEGKLGGASQVTLPGIPAYANTASGAYRATITGGVAAFGRLGYNISGWVPFVRAGLGIARFAESMDFDATGARSCTLVSGQPSCTSGGLVASRRSGILPSALVGAGLEIPYGRFFARIDAEAEAAFQPSQNLMRTLANQAVVTVTGGSTGTAASTVGQASLRSENWIIARRLMISGGFRF
jgi:hypothetical protein